MDQAARIIGATIELNGAETTLKRYILSNFRSAYVHDMLVIRFDRAAQNLQRAESVNTPA